MIGTDRTESMMEKPVATTFRIVYNNLACGPETILSWGMGCVVEGSGKPLLFDTGGDGSVLLANMKVMGIDPKDVDTVVLSHAHSDHTGGLDSFLAANPSITLYVPRSFPDDFKRRMKAHQVRFSEVSDPVEIRSGVYSTGELGAAVREQALAVETGAGMVVVTGCAHPDVVKMTKRALELFNMNIHLVTGGFHLTGASGDQIRSITSELKRLGVQKIGPSHCTGAKAIGEFREAWGDGFVSAGCGAIIAVPQESVSRSGAHG